MAITYYPGIPLAADDQDYSQPQILANFTGINSWTGVNHYNFAAANAGKHSALQLPEQGAVPATAANEAALFAQEGAYSGVTELAFKREGNPAGVIEFTAGKSATLGWTLLPSGFIIKWGFIQWNVGNPQEQTYVIPSAGTDGPTIATLYHLNLSTYNGAATNYDQYVTLGGFSTGTQTITYYASKRTTTGPDLVNAMRFYYFALGVPS